MNSRLRFALWALFLPLLLLWSSGCDSQKATEDFEDAAAATPSGFSATDGLGGVLSEDADDWRTAPFFLGKVRVEPAYPNPVTAGLVTVPVTVLEFDAISGDLVLRARNASGRLVIVDEIPEASSPGGYNFQFAPAILARNDLVRLFVLDRIGNIISYGDISLTPANQD